MPSSTSPSLPDTASTANKVASYTLVASSPTSSQVATETSQASHRLDLAHIWGISPGSRILEIGCGQGTCTAALAEIVGPTGFIEAVDPGVPDYGTPYTLAQSQAHISQSAVGDRIAWHHADPVAFLLRESVTKWDAAVLAHCTWYFDRPELLLLILQNLRGRVGRVFIAEYALKASEKSAMPHLLASIARATKEAHNPSSTANIRCLLGPKQIVEVANAARWRLEKERTIVPGPALQDGEWEISSVVRERFLEDVESFDHVPRVWALLGSLREAVLASMEQLDEGEKVRTMDVWAASFV